MRRAPRRPLRVAVDAPQAEPLLKLSSGVFVRASSAWRVSDDATAVEEFGSGVLRRVGSRYALEGAGTQIISDNPQQIDESPGDWVRSNSSGAYTVTANAAADPLGTTKAANHTFGADANDRCNGNVAALAALTVHRGSVWAWTPSGTKQFRIRIGDQFSADLVATTTVQRWSTVLTTGAAPTNLIRLYNGSAAGAGSVYFWGAHLQTGAPNLDTSPVLQASATRAADDLSFASLPAALRTEGFWFYMWPYCDDAGAVAHSANQSILSGNGGTDLVFLNSAQRIRVRTVTNNPWAQSDPLTWSVRQRLTVVVDFVAGNLRIAGATSGNGTFAGFASDSFLNTNYNVGASVSVTLNYFGELSDFFPLGTAPI